MGEQLSELAKGVAGLSTLVTEALEPGTNTESVEQLADEVVAFMGLPAGRANSTAFVLPERTVGGP